MISFFNIWINKIVNFPQVNTRRLLNLILTIRISNSGPVNNARLIFRAHAWSLNKMVYQSKLRNVLIA